MTATHELTGDQARAILLREYREKAAALTELRDKLAAKIKTVRRRHRQRFPVKTAQRMVRELERTLDWLNHQTADLAAEIKTRAASARIA